MENRGKGRILRRVLVAFALVVAVCAGALWWYASDYYHADAVASAAAADVDGASDGVSVQELAGGKLAFVPAHATWGLVFYPGAKVEPEAYAPLLTSCAREGILCVLARPPLNIAFFDMNAAQGVAEQFPEVEHWLVGGHSLGGVVASSYLDKHEDELAGLVLLASYPTADLTDFGGTVISVVGERDGVLDHERYEEARSKLPTSTQELVIVGGNHAGFGNYGAQEGDEAATISADEQQRQTVAGICALVEGDTPAASGISVL